MINLFLDYKELILSNIKYCEKCSDSNCINC